MTHVAVLGPGGVGGLVAAALDRAGTPVTVVAREETVETIERDGIRVRSVRLGDFTARPRAVAQLSLAPDVLIVATKATGLDEALQRVTGAPLVVPLLNGVDHVAKLRERFAHVLAAVIRVESDRPAPGIVVQTSPFLRIDLAPDPEANALVHLLRAAEIPAQVGTSEADVLWRKLVRLNALALTTTAYDLPLGEVRNRHRDELTGAVDEGEAVARAEGAEVDGVIAELWDAHAELTSSMQRDVAAGRPPELDAIAGAVLRAGARHGIATPTVSDLAERVRARTASRLP